MYAIKLRGGVGLKLESGYNLRFRKFRLQPVVSVLKQNLFDDIPADLPEELVETLASGKSFRIERIVSAGHASKPGFWYDQTQHEWVVLLSGAARIEFDDEKKSVDLAPGDYLSIPAGCRHRVGWTSLEETTVWLAIHFTE